MHGRVVATILLLFLILFSAAPAIASFRISNAQQSCPSNDMLRIALAPIPNSFNLLTAAGDSPYAINSIQQDGIAPFPLVLKNGSLWWNDVLTDSITSNSNYTQWTFHLKPGLKWSDGTSITAQDIINNFGTPGKMAANATYDFVGLSSELVRSYAVNTSTAVIVLNTSDAHFPERISQYYYTSLEPPQDVAAGPGAAYFGSDVAAGPFYNVNYTSGGTTLKMLRNPYFHSPTPTACEIDVNFVENSASFTQFLVSNQIDAAGNIPYASMPSLTNVPSLKFNIINGWFGTRLSYNVLHYPYNMTQFRQALAYAINDSAIVQNALLHYGVPATDSQGGIPDTYANYDSNQVKYTFNPSTAISLLQSIGFKSSGGTLQYPNGTAVSLTLWTDNNKAWDVDVANLIVTYLNAIGIKVNTQVTSTSNIAGDFGSDAFGIREAMILYTSGGPFFPDTWLDAQTPCTVYGTPGCYPDNPTGFPPSVANAYQGNLTAIDSTSDPALVQKYSNNVQEMSSQSLPQIMVVYPDQIWAYSTSRWTNWPQSPSFIGFGSFANATAFAAVVPLGTTSTTSTSSSSVLTSSSSTGVTSATTSVVSSATSASTSSTSSASSAAVSLSTGIIGLIAGVVVVIAIVAGVVPYFMRRKK